MNIESANLSSLAPSSGTVESVSPPLIDGGVISEGFSGALVAQIELLSNIKTEGFVAFTDTGSLLVCKVSTFARCCRFTCRQS